MIQNIGFIIKTLAGKRSRQVKTGRIEKRQMKSQQRRFVLTLVLVNIQSCATIGYKAKKTSNSLYCHYRGDIRFYILIRANNNNMNLQYNSCMELPLSQNNTVF